MDDSAAILDYASPRKRGRLRLPADSRIDVMLRDGKLEIVESLRGRTQARAAIAFWLFSLLVAAGAVLLTVYDFTLHRFHRDWAVVVLFAPALLIGTAAVFCAVHQTWRQTVLSARRGDLTLRFQASFRHDRHRWATADIADIAVVPMENCEDDGTSDPDNDGTAAEVVITRSDASDVRLFSGHPRGLLVLIAQGALGVFREGRTVEEVLDMIRRPVEPGGEAPPDDTISMNGGIDASDANAP